MCKMVYVCSVELLDEIDEWEPEAGIDMCPSENSLWAVTVQYRSAIRSLEQYRPCSASHSRV